MVGFRKSSILIITQKHYIECMNIQYLSDISKELGLKNISVQYNGIFGVWLENKEKKTLLTRTLVKTIWLLGKIISKVIPIESKLFSPYIVLTGHK